MKTEIGSGISKVKLFNISIFIRWLYGGRDLLSKIIINIDHIYKCLLNNKQPKVCFGVQ